MATVDKPTDPRIRYVDVTRNTEGGSFGETMAEQEFKNRYPEVYSLFCHEAESHRMFRSIRIARGNDELVFSPHCHWYCSYYFKGG